MADVYIGGGKRTDSYNGKLDFDREKSLILGRDENFLPRLQILADGQNFRMKVSKEDVDVFTATDDQLVFDSSRNLFKIVETGIIDVVKPINSTTASNFTTVSVTNPTILVFVVPFYGSSFGVQQSPYSIIQLGGADAGKVLYEARANVQGTTIDFLVTTPNIASGYYGTAFTTRFRYYVIQETAAA